MRAYEQGWANCQAPKTGRVQGASHLACILLTTLLVLSVTRSKPCAADDHTAVKQTRPALR